MNNRQMFNTPEIAEPVISPPHANREIRRGNRSTNFSNARRQNRNAARIAKSVRLYSRAMRSPFCRVYSMAGGAS